MDNKNSLITTNEQHGPIYSDKLPVTIESQFEVVNEIIEQNKYIIQKCIACNLVDDCPYTRKRLKKLKEEAETKAQEIYNEEIAFDSSAENLLKAESKRTIYFKEYIKTNARQLLEKERCFFEKRDVKNVLESFVNNNYKLSDPRAQIIVNELLSNIIQNSRINKTFAIEGMTLNRQTSAGIIKYQHPLISTKTEFSKMIVDAIDRLDKILKSDEDVKAENDFTAHLLKQLRMQEEPEKKRRIIENIDTTIIDAEILDLDD
jgi:paraquat-inducible protein B